MEAWNFFIISSMLGLSADLLEVTANFSLGAGLLFSIIRALCASCRLVG